MSQDIDERAVEQEKKEAEIKDEELDKVSGGQHPGFEKGPEPEGGRHIDPMGGIHNKK